MRTLLLALLIALGCAGAQAAPIYRCGNTYSQKPCTGGKVVDASDPRTAAQRAEARRLAAKEKREAAKNFKAAASAASSASPAGSQ